MRRPRYPGRNPRTFQHKYKELQPERYEADVARVVAAGKTPAGMHRPIMVAELLAAVTPRGGDVVVDCTLGYGGHARALLDHVRPGGRLIGLDQDPLELPRAEARLRAAGYSPDVLSLQRASFAGLAAALAREGLASADIIVADLGVSSMQIDNPERGFTFKVAAPLDMRMNPARGLTAAEWLARVGTSDLATTLADHADEPHADALAGALAGRRLQTTRDLADTVRTVVREVRPRAGDDDVERSVRRVFQAVRIAVNDEFGALDALLRALPGCLAAGGRAGILTFHSGEDRRVKKAFQAGVRDGVYAATNDDVGRASAAETRANPRAASAKLRWVRRA